MPSSLSFILYSSFFNLFRVLCRAHFNTNFERLWIQTDCYYKGNYKWGRLTSSLQISLMKCWASFMAPGVGANTEKVSSSTWLIVTPKGKEENVVTFLYSAQQFLLWKRNLRAAGLASHHHHIPSCLFQTLLLIHYLFELEACGGCSLQGQQSELALRQVPGHFLKTENIT